MKTKQERILERALAKLRWHTGLKELYGHMTPCELLATQGVGMKLAESQRYLYAAAEKWRKEGRSGLINVYFLRSDVPKEFLRRINTEGMECHGK